MHKITSILDNLKQNIVRIILFSQRNSTNRTNDAQQYLFYHDHVNISEKPHFLNTFMFIRRFENIAIAELSVMG